MMNSGKRLRFKIFFFRPEYSIHDPLHCLDITTQPNEPESFPPFYLYKMTANDIKT